MITKKLSPEVLTILKTAKIDGLTLRLTCAKLDRQLYLEVNEALEALGGNWNKKTQGHDFKENPTEKLQNAILTGEVTPPSKNGYFPTPKPIVRQLIELADIKAGMDVLEPSAGQGAIAEELRSIGAKVVCCEILPENIEVLKQKGYELAAEDFFTFNQNDSVDRVVMNPPFEQEADIDHVLHAYDMLKQNGLLVSVMSSGTTFRNDKKAVDFRRFVEANNGKIVPLPINSFKESGTGVNTVIAVIPKYQAVKPCKKAVTLFDFCGQTQQPKIAQPKKTIVPSVHRRQTVEVRKEPEEEPDLDKLWAELEKNQEESNKAFAELKKIMVDDGLIKVFNMSESQSKES